MLNARNKGNKCPILAHRTNFLPYKFHPRNWQQWKKQHIHDHGHDDEEAVALALAPQARFPAKTQTVSWSANDQILTRHLQGRQPCPGSKRIHHEAARQLLKEALQVAQECLAAIQGLFLKAAKATRLPNFLPVGVALVESQSMMELLTLLPREAAPKELILLPAPVGAWILCLKEGQGQVPSHLQGFCHACRRPCLLCTCSRLSPP